MVGEETLNIVYKRWPVLKSVFR